MIKVSSYIDSVSKYLGVIASFMLNLLTLLVVYDTLMRYFFAAGSIILQELEWYFFDVVFLFGLSYALKHDTHVRVDIFFENFSKEMQLMLKIVSMLLLLLPFSSMMILDTFDMVWQSYTQHEVSYNAGGLEQRWIIKAVLLLAFITLFMQGVSETVKSYINLSDKTTLIKIGGILLLFAGFIYYGWYYRMAFWIDPLYLMFILTFLLLMLGFEVAFVFGGVALFFALITDEVGLSVLEMLPHRTYGIMGNITLMAVPLFIFMGLVLEKSKMAEGLIVSMGKLFGSIRGGLAISVVFVGAILGASTGIVGASVVMMSLIALPLMLKHGYSASLAGGSIAASGTLGQLIPPSIVLIILGDQMHLSVGDLFRVAIVPSILLIFLYILYILIYAYLKKDVAPAVVSNQSYRDILKEGVREITPPLLLIGVVLGSIFLGISSPTESAGVGVIGAILLAIFKKSFSFELIRYASIETVKLTAMIFMILLGATAFSLVFNELGGGDIVVTFFTQDQESRWQFIFIAMLVIFILGFFIDFIEIAFVVVPILVPIVALLEIDPLWFAILIAMNLQASFLTPPFGFALFYLKGAAGDKIGTKDIYKGVIPFILLQLLGLGIMMIFPDLIYIFEKK